MTAEAAAAAVDRLAVSRRQEYSDRRAGHWRVSGTTGKAACLATAPLACTAVGEIGTALGAGGKGKLA